MLGPGSFLLALTAAGSVSGPPGPNALFIRVDAGDLVAEPGKLADPDLDRPHGREHALFRLVDQELVPGLGLDDRVQAGGAQEWRADWYSPNRLTDDQGAVGLADPPAPTGELLDDPGAQLGVRTGQETVIEPAADKPPDCPAASDPQRHSAAKMA